MCILRAANFLESSPDLKRLATFLAQRNQVITQKIWCFFSRCRARYHWENYVSISFQIEWDMIVVTVFIVILNQMELHLVQNRNENCHHNHIPFNVTGNGNLAFSVYATCFLEIHRRHGFMFHGFMFHGFIIHE